MSTRWDVEQYTRFQGPRLRPGLDLISRIPHPGPRMIVDVGCGTADLTAVLASRWPQASVIGIDHSAEMVAVARAAHPTLAVDHADLRTWQPPSPVDVLFSNAVLMWVPNHGEVMPALLGHLTPGGVLAIQMSDNFQSPAHRAIGGTLDALGLSDRVTPLGEPVASTDVYCRMLAPYAAALDIWQTTYWHPLTGTDPVVEWLKGTALRPVLQGLQAADRMRFLDRYRQVVATAYPREPDGTTWFPFRRLFLVVTKA